MRRNEVSGAPVEGYKPPREDINAPDLYIPVMAFVTYILLSAFLSGIQGHFSPEDFSVTASYAFAVVLFEIIAIKESTTETMRAPIGICSATSPCGYPFPS